MPLILHDGYLKSILNFFEAQDQIFLSGPYQNSERRRRSSCDNELKDFSPYNLASLALHQGSVCLPPHRLHVLVPWLQTMG